MLQIDRLVKVYPGSVAALQSVSLDIGRGLFGLLGPNGAGKSTLMRILAGLLEPTSGRVLLDGVDVTADPAHVRARLGYLPQSFGFYPSLTGAAMLEHLLRLKGVDAPGGRRKLALALLDRVNLGAAAQRKVKGYSGGMRQRLGIAQALAGEPALLVVDEPTVGLDPEERLRFYRLLAGLAEDRIVLLSTHLVEDVAMMCPRFAVLHRGEVLADTTPTEARAALAGRVVQGSAVEVAPKGTTLLRTHLAEGRALARLRVAEGAVPEGFAPAEATLEDAYFSLLRDADMQPSAEIASLPPAR